MTCVMDAVAGMFGGMSSRLTELVGHRMNMPIASSFSDNNAHSILAD